MDLGGVKEVCEELGISRQRLLKLRERSEFPNPVADLSSGPVWDLADVRRFAASPRKPGRPSRTAVRQELGNRFELEEPPIGSGGFAQVYRAVDRVAVGKGMDTSVVAVKVLRPEQDSDGRHRFSRELRMLENIEHPHVMPILASGDNYGGRPWYAMPLAVGSLEDALAYISQADRRIVDVMRQICAGLAHLHEGGVWHRDLTPMNVLLRADGSWAISDFGLAREAERRTATLTTTTKILGTYYYAAPEQLQALKNAGPEADIFSAGKVLEALVRGQHPVPGTKHPSTPFREIIRRATETDPGDRYPNVSEFLADIERVVAVPRGRWESTEEALERLRARIEQGSDKADLEALMDIAANSSEDDLDMARDLSLVMVKLDEDQIAYLWEKDPDGFRHMYRVFSAAIQHFKNFIFAFCDDLANFVSRTVAVTGQDPDIILDGVHGLGELGQGHNRWHVRTVLHRILQNLRQTDLALTGLAGVRRMSTDALEWNFEDQDFVMRSLHPALKDGITDLLPARRSVVAPTDPPF